jgi:hypothetical protein
MAQLYFNEQLIATDTLHGVLGAHLVNEEVVITYDHKKNKFYTIIIYDNNDVHSLMINVKGDDLATGEIIVDFAPFNIRTVNYEAAICIYEQPRKLPLPDDDFDMEMYQNDNKLKLIYVIEFTVLQSLTRKPNIYSNRVYNSKLKNHKTTKTSKPRKLQL